MDRKQEVSVIVRTVSRMMIPFIQLFGLYVIVHGESSPGGGFQGGVILGASIILLAIVFGLGEAERRMPRRLAITLMCVGLLIYSGIGLLDMFAGGRYLEYPTEFSALSILGVEFGIGITVMAVTSLLFFYLVGDCNGG